MIYEAEGTVKRVCDKQTFSKGFCKRNLIVEVGDKFKKTVSFEFKKDRADLLDDIAAGMQVQVKFDIDGREWQDPKGGTKYFVSLEGIGVKSKGGVSRAAVPATPQAADFGDVTDDMPF